MGRRSIALGIWRSVVTILVSAQVRQSPTNALQYLPLDNHVLNRPDSKFFECPSRRRRRDRIGRAISQGEQPVGTCYQPLTRQGCAPAGFLRQLHALQHSAVALPPMPSLWIQSLTSMVENWPDLHRWRKAQLQPIRDAAHRLQCNRKAWADRLHPDVWNVIGHLRLLSWIGWQDTRNTKDRTTPSARWMVRLLCGISRQVAYLSQNEMRRR